MKTLGRLSDGIRLGWKSGFDSGQTLDYVYRNRARGITPLGRLIDRMYLDSPGWRGIRERGELLRGTLRRAMKRVHRGGRPVTVLDIASGPGRYVLETLDDLKGIPARALLRDRTPANLAEGRRLAAALGLAGVRFEAADAFDRVSLASVRPRPTIAIVSGLYELFSDNEMVLRSLLGLADAIDRDGFLIYTNQPWHPQLELIANVLTNRQGRPWVMRCRPQAEMDALVRAAGFTKLDMTIDELGIFTVSLARPSPST